MLFCIAKNYFSLCLSISCVAELMFLETSAKTGENVEESFLKCSKTILAKIETGKCDSCLKYYNSDIKS